MKYSLPGNPTNHSINNEPDKPIDFYNIVRANSYSMPCFNTISPNSISKSIRKPLADPNVQVSSTINTVEASSSVEASNTMNKKIGSTPIITVGSNAPTTLTKPKTTFPTKEVSSYVPNKPQTIYANPSNIAKAEPMNLVPTLHTKVPNPIPTTITNPSVNNINMVASELNHSIYHSPIGVPLMPLYGYDNCDDADKDFDYMKQMYPIAAKKMFHEINEECDKLEYEGSCMFDEYPDKIYLGRIVDRIYDKCKHLMEEPVVANQYNPGYNYDKDDRGYDRRHDRYDRDNNKRYDRYDRDNDKHHNRHNNNRFRDLIEVLFFNEILNRRRRFRSRRRWY